MWQNIRLDGIELGLSGAGRVAALLGAISNILTARSFPDAIECGAAVHHHLLIDDMVKWRPVTLPALNHNPHARLTGTLPYRHLKGQSKDITKSG